MKKVGLLFYVLLTIGCHKRENTTNSLYSDNNRVDEYYKSIKKLETDTTNLYVLVHKENRKIEDDLLMLKNTAFCICINREENKIISIYPNKYHPIPDNSIRGYMEYSEYLSSELFLRNKELDSLVNYWSNKRYLSQIQEDNKERSYLIYMKCLDFYNSDLLKKYIDSIRINYK